MSRYSNRMETTKGTVVVPKTVTEKPVSKAKVAKPKTAKVEANTPTKAKPVVATENEETKKDGRLRDFDTKNKTLRLVSAVADDTEFDFKMKKLKKEMHSSFSFGMYISDLVYMAQTGEHLFNYQTGEVVGDLNKLKK